MPLAAALTAELRVESASEADRDPLYVPYKLALQPYVTWAWGWDEAKEQHNFFERLPLSGLFKLVFKGQCIGGFCLDTAGDAAWHLRTFFIHPQLHGQGLGTAVLQHLIRQAQHQRRALTLHVIHINPAKRLYERLGFEVIQQEEKSFLMRCKLSVGANG